MKFVKQNLNPKSSNCGDCVIRALAGAFVVTWRDIFLGLMPIAHDNYWLPNSKQCYEYYLTERRETTPLKLVVKKGDKRKKVKDFTKGTWVLSCANHLTHVRDGVCYDTWDCTEKAVYKAWKVE